MIKVKKKDKVTEVPKFNSHSGFSKEHWNSLNQGKVISVDEIPEVAQPFVEEVKSKGK
tara:strand:+ start:509 stop:682 length:174 start_codon:yes stop_codon:yes gene_type:complete